MSQNWTPPPGGGAAPAGAPPPNYLVPAILATLFCCLPAGIVSIIFATQVNSKYAAGDVAGAAGASKNAKMWMMISAGLGIAVWVIVIIMNVIGAVATSR
jgi:hypothetical protein